MPGTTPTVDRVRCRAESPMSPCRRGDGAPDPLVVGQRLPHPHEHHVGEPPGPGRPDRLGHLLDDLPGGELALEPGLSRGAELAGHGATGLGGDADGDPVGVVHEDGFDLRVVVERPEPFGRLPVIGGPTARPRGAPGGAHRRAWRATPRADRSSLRGAAHGACRPSQTWRARKAGWSPRSRSNSSRVRS